MAKKTKAVTHREQSTKIVSRNVVVGGYGNSDNNGNNDDGNGDSNNDNDIDRGSSSSQRAMAATDDMVWGIIRWLEAAESGIKRKWEQCGYDRLKILISNIVSWVYLYMYPTVSPSY